MTGPRLRTTAGGSPLPSFTPVHSPLLQRKCACGGTSGPTGECESCRKKKLQRRQGSLAAPSPVNHPPSPVSEVPAIVHEVLRSPGQPLEEGTRTFMEPRMGHDFSRVRVHSDSIAAQSARDVNALAYTVEHDVVFGAGQYQPSTASGRRLIAHELAHVMQQNNGKAAPQDLTIGATNNAAEAEADSVAALVADGARASGQGTVQTAERLQRKPNLASSNRETTKGSAAQEMDTSSRAETESGGLCFRTPFPPGQIRFEGCSNEQLSRYRIFPEDGDQLVNPMANMWQEGDGVWSMDHTPADEWFKVSDHCDMTLHCSGRGFSGSSCCNALASLLMGKPRWVNDEHEAKKNLPKSQH